MTLAEAVKTGRPFKRSKHIEWLKMRPQSGVTYADGMMPLPVLFHEDILADDWTIQPRSVKFKCEWSEVDCYDGKRRMVPLASYLELKEFAGKKTVVTVEVVE